MTDRPGDHAGAWLRRVAAALLVLVVVAFALTGRAIVDGREEMVASDAAFDDGDVRRSLLHARRAAVHYAPGVGHLGPAYARMEAIARGAEAAGEVELAAAAYRAVRGAALETRHLWTPHPQALRRASDGLARLAARQSGMGAAGRREQRLRLETRHTPSAPWNVLLLAAFLLMAGGLLAMVWRGVDRAGEIDLRRALVPAVVALLGVGAWVVTVVNA